MILGVFSLYYSIKYSLIREPKVINSATFTKNAVNEMIDCLIVSSDDTNTYESFIQNKATTLFQKGLEGRKRIQEQS